MAGTPNTMLRTITRSKPKNYAASQLRQRTIADSVASSPTAISAASCQTGSPHLHKRTVAPSTFPALGQPTSGTQQATIVLRGSRSSISDPAPGQRRTSNTRRSPRKSHSKPSVRQLHALQEEEEGCDVGGGSTPGTNTYHNTESSMSRNNTIRLDEGSKQRTKRRESRSIKTSEFAFKYKQPRRREGQNGR
jgi:hypothetical protein